MTCAVRVPDMHSVYFLTDLPDDREGLDVEEGAWLDVPVNINLWPEGSRRPESVLCRSREDPKHYKIFKYRNEIEGTEWEESDYGFGGTFSKPSWERFAAKFPAIRALHAIPDDEGV